ncbi:YicC family protein [Sporanaerobium hydrogeniformans]|uniref:YicC family protein n=1 Tax=Sporanaerobium hydrogeniformans TaxID=3072179 RepID=A0AC61DGK4_9FIRM|nr:YicC/YloC family endoribonuclease [Sporanaerobium hydrogeniformans]PHV71796.1 YicC family protein [Sporanaerobium hydrogeniformans]
MIYSMTGYGRSEKQENNRKITVEMSTINHRYCDVNIKLPRTLASLEEKIKERIKQKIQRGKLEASIFYVSTAEEDLEFTINTALCEGYLKGFREIGKSFALEDDLKLSHLLELSDVVTLQKKAGDQEAVEELLFESLDEALIELLAMRQKEGEALKEDILLKNNSIKDLVASIEERSPLVVEEYKKRLETKLEMLLGKDIVDPNRLATEVAIMADKCAIDEELTRLKSHCSQLTTILQEEGAIGRKLDFLMQEMNREANTIGSKANDYRITKDVVLLKAEIEKVREQVQNIE